MTDTYELTYLEIASTHPHVVQMDFLLRNYNQDSFFMWQRVSHTYNEMLEWCESVMVSEYPYQCTCGSENIVFMFADKADAMLFKLRYG